MDRQVPRFLIIEDDVTVSVILGKLIKLWAPSLIDSVITVADAIEHLREYERYDLIILDLMLPDGDGSEVLKYVRDKKITVPVLISSGKDYVDMQNILNLKPDYVFTKPVSIIKLEAIIKKIGKEFKHD